MKKTNFQESLFKGITHFPSLFIDEKETCTLSRIYSFIRYLPNEESYPNFLLTLLKLSKGFKKSRSISHLSRLLCAEYFYKKRVIKAIDQRTQKRYVVVKLFKTQLHFPFGSKRVLGLLIVFNQLKHHEIFEEKHILGAIQTILPGIAGVNGSFQDLQDKSNQIQVLYLEIERKENPEFSLEETARLEAELGEVLEEFIEQLVPIPFMRRNEEEVFRTILTLRDQLRSLKDLPQLTLTFEEQTQHDLFFTVIVLRWVKEKEPSIQTLFEALFPEIPFIPDRVDRMGFFRHHYKEASVFRLQLSKTSFFRKDHSLDIYKARHTLLLKLREVLGPVRDYNGGLILKQNERLEDFLMKMGAREDKFFLENFFYSITPIMMQSILPASTMQKWVECFSEIFDQEMPKTTSYSIESKYREDKVFIIIRSEKPSFKGEVLKFIALQEIPSLNLAYTEFKRDGIYYFSFLYRFSQLEGVEAFIGGIKSRLASWQLSLEPDQILRMGIFGHELSLDPRIIKEDNSSILIRMLFDGLTRKGPDGSLQLAIAESYEVSADYKIYTFFLRDSKWSNGAPITAYDFEYSWKKSLHPKTFNPYSKALYLIKNARLAHQGKLPLSRIGLQSINDKTLRVELEYPAPYFLEAISHITFTLINSGVDQKNPDWAYHAGETFVSNGPFKLIEWKQNRSIILEKNSAYWDAEAVSLKKIAVNILEGGKNHPLKKGELDIIGRPMGSYPIGTSFSPDEVDKISFPLCGVFMLFFNTSLFPFNNKSLRQAFAYAIDREVFNSVLESEFGGSSYTILPEQLSLHKEPLFPLYDLEKARSLFREGLGELGFVKSDIQPLTVHYCSGMKREAFFTLLVSQWQKAFDIEIGQQSYEWDTYINRITQGDYKIGGVELQANWGDSLHVLETFEENHYSFWEHPQYRSFLNKAKSASTIEQRDLFLQKAEKFFAEEMPAIPLYQLTGNYLKRKELQGVTTSEFFQIDFKWSSKHEG